MEFRKLQYFESVARLSNFTKAAEELYVAQPTITTAIKRMEEELGVPLFVRDKRKVLLTYEGEVFLEKVKDILKRFDQAIFDMQEMSANHEWTVNIGIVPISGSSLLAVLYQGLTEKYPNIRYKILEIGSYGIEDAIKRGEMDIGYLILRDNMQEKYNICRVHKSELKVLVHIEHPLACRQSLSVRDLKDEKIIYFPQHSYVRQKMDAEFQRCGVVPNIFAEPVQMISLYNLVQHNAGISFSVGEYYDSMIRSEDIVAIPLEEPVYCETGFIWKKGEKLNYAAQRCLEYVQEHAEEL
ncbi:MAG: LysR family transcriptional regulator [Clostridia bacterium]|nr:LysR family transcriptional regulator [Clostridia bacterium]NCC44109.1 LysR family transcriptional regulator [Clostridia bacterium]